jgi:hypothetical protein
MCESLQVVYQETRWYNRTFPQLQPGSSRDIDVLAGKFRIVEAVNNEIVNDG